MILLAQIMVICPTEMSIASAVLYLVVAMLHKVENVERQERNQDTVSAFPQ